MLDRASTFADPEIVEWLKTRFVPVAIDQAYQRRQKDTEGDFYRKIASQGPRNDFDGTTQGLYIATADGTLLSYNNNRGAERIKRLMKEALKTPQPDSIVSITDRKYDPRFNVQPPRGGLVIRVRAKVMGGYEPSDNQWKQIFQSAVSRDNLWVSKTEHEALVAGDIPASLQRRIAKFHLVDNTRGEPPMWNDHEIQDLQMKITDDKLTGRVRLETKDGRRGYDAELLGELKAVDGKIVQFDVVALGEFWGSGRFTGNAPKGKFPLAVSFSLADGTDVADRIPPQGSRGWLRGYLDTP